MVGDTDTPALSSVLPEKRDNSNDKGHIRRQTKFVSQLPAQHNITGTASWVKPVHSVYCTKVLPLVKRLAFVMQEDNASKGTLPASL